MRKLNQTFGNVAYGAFSDSNNYATETNNFGETAFGILNKSTIDPDNFTSRDVVKSSKATLFSIGNGTEEERKNVIEIKGNGDVYINGVAGYTGTDTDQAGNIAEEFQGVHDSIDELDRRADETDVEIGEINQHLDNVDSTLDSIHIQKDSDSDLVYTLVIDGEERGTINIPKDQFLEDVSYDPDTKELIFIFVTSDENNKEVRINIENLVDVYSAGNGLSLADGQFAIKLDPSTESYITVGADGLKISGLDSKFDTLTLKDAELDGRILTTETDIDALLSDLSALKGDGEGSIGNLILTAVDALKGGVSESYDTLKKIEDGITSTNDKFDEYLPLTGGTISGSITFESEPDTNGHEYVDLGLPSGNLWAKCNIGAETEEETGLYFAWGETQGYTAEQVGIEEGQKAFSWADYKFVTGGFPINFSKYNDSDDKIVLDLEDDAAHAIMGGNWRMPTFEEYKELCLNTDIYLVPTEGAEIQGTVQEQSGGSIIIKWASQAEGTLKGVKFYKKGDKQTYMFVPTSGFAGDDRVQNISEYGYLLASSRLSSNVNNAYNFSFLVDTGRIDLIFRYCGIPVRGVYPKSYTGNIITVSGKTSTDLLNATGGTTSVDDIATQVQAAIVDSAPETLDTLNELAAALGDDPNFATTVTNQIAQKADLSILPDYIITSISQDVQYTDNNVSLKHHFVSKGNNYSTTSSSVNTFKPATSTTAGVMSAADKAKLDGIDLSNYVTLSTYQDITGSNTYTGANYISKETNLTDAVMQLDEEIKAANDNIDLEHANAEATYVKKTGDTMTGDLTVPNVKATKFIGPLQGNADTATKATQDANGDVIVDTYAKKVEVPTKVSQLTNDSGYQTETQVSAKISALVDSAPETLNTLNELAAALGDDPNFATTITNQIAQKADKTTATTSANGLMSAADKTKLDGINTSNYATQDDLDGYLPLTGGKLTGNVHINMNSGGLDNGDASLGLMRSSNGIWQCTLFNKLDLVNNPNADTVGLLARGFSATLGDSSVKLGFIGKHYSNMLPEYRNDPLLVLDNFNGEIEIGVDGITISDKTASDLLHAAGGTTTLKTINGESLLGSGDITTPTPTVNAASGTKTIWTGTQSQYEAVSPKDSNTLYFITEG